MRRRGLAALTYVLAFVLSSVGVVACSGDDGETPFGLDDGGCLQLGTEGCMCLGGECIGDLVCASNVCVDPNDLTTGGVGSGDESGDDGTTEGGDDTSDGDGTSDGDASTDAGDATTGTTGTDGGDAGDSGDTGGGLAQVLDRCQSDTECGEGLACRQMTKSSTLMRCTPSCVSTAQCPLHTRCIDDGTGGKRCLGEDIGQTCTQATDCNFACLTNPGYCVDACSSGGDCPVGYGCQEIGTPAQRVCVRVEALCSDTDASECVVPSACDLSPNLILGSCTIACATAADCPQRAAGLAPWTCDGLCRRPADVAGGLPGGTTPTEWFCDAGLNPIVLCHDAQHIDFNAFTIPSPPAVDCFASVTTTGAANDSCVNSCRAQGGCASGTACVSVGGIGGGRIGLCLPTGPLRTGESCTANPQCEFGYCSNGSCSRDCTFDDVCPEGLSCVAGGSPDVEGLPFKRCE